MLRSLERRGEIEVEGWRRMLADLATEPSDRFVDWLAIDRIDGQETDVGMHRHWVDPTIPFATTVAEPAHGPTHPEASLLSGHAPVSPSIEVHPQPQ